jgi:hypothetical protein
MVKCTKNIFGVMDIFYTYLFVCAHNVHYVLLLFMMPIVLLCFRWVHFLWCGYVCVSVLMDVNQGYRRDKEELLGGVDGLFLLKVFGMCGDISGDFLHFDKYRV